MRLNNNIVTRGFNLRQIRLELELVLLQWNVEGGSVKFHFYQKAKSFEFQFSIKALIIYLRISSPSTSPQTNSTVSNLRQHSNGFRRCLWLWKHFLTFRFLRSCASVGRVRWLFKSLSRKHSTSLSLKTPRVINSYKQNEEALRTRWNACMRASTSDVFLYDYMQQNIVASN